MGVGKSRLFLSWLEDLVDWTAKRSDLPPAYMRVDLGRLYTAMPQKRLDEPDVYALLQQVSRKRMPQCVYRNMLAYAHLLCSVLEHLLRTSH